VGFVNGKFEVVRREELVAQHAADLDIFTEKCHGKK
jgi:hypothetical protein